MKKGIGIWILAVLLSFGVDLLAFMPTDTIPQGFHYQGILRDAAGDETKNQNITLRVSVQNDTSATADIQWQETHYVQTNEFGLFSIVVGRGTYLGGLQSIFKEIPWTAFNMVMKIEVDRGNGFEDMGINQLLSVPYALSSGNGQGPAGADGLDGLNSLVIFF